MKYRIWILVGLLLIISPCFAAVGPLNTIPLWIKITYTLMVVIVVPIYWKKYGPLNFLWLSDVALFIMLVAVWSESGLLASMMALGVMPLEIYWSLDFLSGARLGGISSYMFDRNLPLYLRSLSLFHIPLLFAIVYMVIKYGYNPDALPFQILVFWVLFPSTYLLAKHSSENINWVYGLGYNKKKLKHPLIYLLFFLMGVTMLCLALHFVLKAFFETDMIKYLSH